MNERTRQQRKGSSGIVPVGTKGLYDANKTVRSKTAREMVRRRSKMMVSCDAPGCVDPATGLPRVFESRVVNGEPEKRTCRQACQMRAWRADMKARGFKQVTRDGVLGWQGPDGAFTPMPSQPKPRGDGTRQRRKRTVNVESGDTATQGAKYRRAALRGG